VFYYLKIAPDILSHLPIYGFLVLFSTLKKNFELKFREDGLLVDLKLLSKGILKIANCMWYESPQSELLSTCILKHTKYYFGVFFGE